MRNLKAALSYNFSSENSYLKLFQIANQNLILVMKEEQASKLVRNRNDNRKEMRPAK